MVSGQGWPIRYGFTETYKDSRSRQGSTISGVTDNYGRLLQLNFAENLPKLYKYDQSLYKSNRMSMSLFDCLYVFP